MNLNHELVEEIARLWLVLFGIGVAIAGLAYVAYRWYQTKHSRF